MASRILVRRALGTTRPRVAVRSFATSVALGKTPALADIHPDEAGNFDSKQSAFRQKQREIKEAKKEQESASATQQAKSLSHSPSQTPSPDDTPSGPPTADAPVEAAPGDIGSKLGLGSYSNDAGKEREQRSQEDLGKRQGALGRLIYGTPEGRELDREIERSFSQVLARGKYVHSIALHKVKPDKVDEYVALVGDWYPKMAALPDNHVHLVGSWRTEVGDCDTFVHIWEYERYRGYHNSLHSISRHPGFPAFDKQLKQLITSKEVSLMQEFSFWPTTPPRKLGGVFELRSYTLHPGNLLEWEHHWRSGLKARKEVMEGVGAWFTQIGELNTVHHLWQFADLEERRARREMSWGIEGWSDTVHKTVPLIQMMKSRILVPMPWSPVG